MKHCLWCQCQEASAGLRRAWVVQDIADLGHAQHVNEEQFNLVWAGKRATAIGLGFCSWSCLEDGVVGSLVALRLMGVAP
jgi:heme oxygenase